MVSFLAEFSAVASIAEIFIFYKAALCSHLRYCYELLVGNATTSSAYERRPNTKDLGKEVARLGPFLAIPKSLRCLIELAETVSTDTDLGRIRPDRVFHENLYSRTRVMGEN